MEMEMNLIKNLKYNINVNIINYFRSTITTEIYGIISSFKKSAFIAYGIKPDIVKSLNDLLPPFY